MTDSKAAGCFLEQETILMAQYWLVPGMDLSVIYIGEECLNEYQSEIKENILKRI